MILSGEGIKFVREEGQIKIDPFDEDQLGPNSYNLTLANTLQTYDFEGHLDPRKVYRMGEETILKSGTLLRPGILYLGKTQEYTETHWHVPMIEGRSSMARLGVFVHVTGGFGDVGFCGNWTLEIVTTHPVMIYPDMKVCQIFYHTIHGPTVTKYDGKYQHDREIGASRYFTELRDSSEDS